MLSQRRAGAILSYANIIVKNLVNLVYTPMLLAFVGQADYGVFQTANSFVFSLTLLSFGFSQTYIRFYTQKKVNGTNADIRILNGMYLLLYVVICTLALVLGFAFAANVRIFFSGNFTPEQVGLAGQLMSIMAVSVAITLFSTVFDAYILAHEQFKFQQTRQLITTLATPFIAFLLLECGMGAVGVAIAQLSVYIALLVLNARFAILKLRMQFSFKTFDKNLFFAIVSFSSWIFANQVCDLVNQNVPNVLLGILTSAVAVSVFAVSVQIRSVFISLSLAMSNVFVPKINKIVASSDDNTELTRLMTRVGRYQMILFCWVYCGFVLLGKFFIIKWAGDGFLDAYYLICAMTLPLGVPLCQNTGIEIQRAKNRHKTRSTVYLGMALFSVLFTWFASPQLGYWAPAIAYIVSITLGNGLFMNWYYHTHIDLDMGFFWKRNLPVVIAAACVTVAGMTVGSFVPVASWFGFFAWGLLYSVAFAGAIWLFVLDDDEKSSVAKKLSVRR